ncbi:MAG: DNA polymerase Y family protein, partial [Terriglobia bacterium]
MNFACIYIPEISLQAAVRAEPELQNQAVAVIDGPPSFSKVIALNAKGCKAGVKLGMTEVQATQTAALQIRCRSLAQERAAHAAILDLGFSFSPRVEDRAIDTIILDLTGLDRLMLSPEALVNRIVQRSSELFLEARIALAPNPDVAEVAARGFPGITFVAAGEEAQRLAPLPLTVLAPDTEIVSILDSWGIRTLGELARLPAEDIAARLGQEASHLQMLARGGSLRPLIPAQASLRFEESLELEYPVALLEPLTFIFSRLLHGLCARLAARGFATNELCLRMDLESPPEA